ncbi:hypothetical protein HPP92_006649 [Vanilla planifolia]|uniref:Glycoside hydrolase family 3 N-terminal domain-containing protein n=1 Tax=Vanilla planifolia TaxID=51239 RepID=A0A835V7W9_VANPL|nr:hypothetical protein HPP92_006649 [Vanilla planifolia]
MRMMDRVQEEWTHFSLLACYGRDGKVVLGSYAFGVFRSVDPRWGRCYESYSEDNTEIVRSMTAIISGLQGSPPEDHLVGKNVISCAKHFVGDGGIYKGGK